MLVRAPLNFKFHMNGFYFSFNVNRFITSFLVSLIFQDLIFLQPNSYNSKFEGKSCLLI
ncbi:unnamed protein product [Musa hybrid cultivar]